MRPVGWAVCAGGGEALAELDADVDRDAQADSPIVRTHQHAAGAAKGG